MRLTVLEVCASIFALLFITALVATVWHRESHRAGDAYPVPPLAEYLWALVPWVIVAGGAFPAVRRILSAL